MIKVMVTACVFWLNMFPPNDGVSITLSPCLLCPYDLLYFGLLHQALLVS
jgi:hypothetical protein